MIELNAKAYIFDFDGTMMHTIPLWIDLDRLYLAKYGLEMPDDLHGAIEGLGYNDCARYFQNRFGITDSEEVIIQEWLDMIHHLIVSHPLKDDVVQFIEKTTRPMAIATSNTRFIIEDVLRVNELSHRFLSITTSDEVGRSKPDPAVFLLAAEKLSVDPKDCVVFEDTTAGVQGAKNAGMTAVAVYDPSNPDWETTKSYADYSIISFDEIGEM